MWPNVTGISDTIMNGCSQALPTNLTPQMLDTCAKGPLGAKLIQLAKDQTDDLNPKHQYVPWVTIEGKPIHTQLNNFTELFCAEFALLNPPYNCNNPPKSFEDEVEVK